MRTQRGLTLLEALVSLAVLGFGMLAVLRMQTNLVAQGGESGTRLLATQLSDRLLGMALVDPTNVECYTVPMSSNCDATSVKTEDARNRTKDWLSDARKALPSLTKIEAAFEEHSLLHQEQPDLKVPALKVTMHWIGKASETYDKGRGAPLNNQPEGEHRLETSVNIRKSL